MDVYGSLPIQMEWADSAPSIVFREAFRHFHTCKFITDNTLLTCWVSRQGHNRACFTHRRTQRVGAGTGGSPGPPHYSYLGGGGVGVVSVHS